MGCVIQLKATKQAKAKAKQAASGHEPKFFGEAEIKTLRRAVRQAAQLAEVRGQVTAIRDWMLIDLLTGTGLRAAEAADLRCGDLLAGPGQSALHVRNGKGGKSRTVQIPDGLRRHIKNFIQWKAGRGEPTGHDDHLLLGQRGPMTSLGVNQTVKKWLRKAGLDRGNGWAAHSLRHSYAVALYRREKDLVAVQKQLGHSNVQTTLVYADCLPDDIQEQVKGLWN